MVVVDLNGNKIEDANLSTANITDTKYYTVEITDSNSDGYYDTVAIK